MSALVMWRSATTQDAERATQLLRDLPAPVREGILDVAAVTWPRRSRTPSTRTVGDLTSERGLGEEFWGVLFALIFWSPLLGAAVASSGEAFTGSFGDFGISDTFVNRVRDTVTPGTSALFVLGSDALVDHLRATVGDQPCDLLVTRLTPRQEGALREVFVG